MIRKTVEGLEFESQMIGELNFDQTPKEGSFNPVTSDAVVKAIDKAKEDMQEKIDEVTLDPSAVAFGNVHLLNEETKFPADGCILIDSETNGPREMSKDTLLELTAQNALAGNVAQAFDPTKPNDAGGYAYYEGEIVAYNGATYRFKANHSSGEWNAAEVDSYDAGESLKLFVVTNDPEYVYAVLDSERTLLFGIKKNGEVEWQAGIPTHIKDAILELSNSKVEKEDGKSLIDEGYAGASSTSDVIEFVKVIRDSDGKVVEAIDYQGCHIFFVPPSYPNGLGYNDDNVNELAQMLKNIGFSSGQGDWSDNESLSIEEPRCAVLNFSGFQEMPASKTADLNGFVQFWDNQGNYFKKRAVVNAQGSSSLAFPKKNIAIDLLNDDGSSFKLKIGEWVEQDSFHIKAYYTDYFRGVATCAYSLYKQILDTRSFFKDRTWKMAMVDEASTSIGYGLGRGAPKKDAERSDYGALCFPMGFPCVVFLNDVFYGIFAFQLKKHRDNYKMSKSDAKNIHLDGHINASSLWDGSIDWTAFEIRNPKGLVLVSGAEYDGDNPQEIMGNDSPAYDPTNKNHVMTAEVKSHIISFSTCMTAIKAARATYEASPTLENLAAARAAYEAVFDKDNGIDYEIFSDVIRNTDGFDKNWQWTTWDGEHWYVNAYDLDMAFGAQFEGDEIRPPKTGHTVSTTSVNIPVAGYIATLWPDEEKARYAELRRSGVLTSHNIVNIVASWVKNIGESSFKKEWTKWPNTPCNNDIVIDDEHWSIVGDVTASPLYTKWDSSTSYVQGNSCSIALESDYSAPMGWYNFTCDVACVGKPPVKEWRFRDSIWRLAKWVDEAFVKLDNLYNFND